MILRNKKISYQSDEVQLHCSFSLPDVKGFLKMYAAMAGGESFWSTYQDNEQGIRFWMEHDYRVFASYPEKWRQQLSGWAFNVALRNRLLIPTAKDENRFYFADCLFAKRGRPKEIK